MVAKLWASQIIKGNKYFHEVPAGLKEQVKNVLINEGYEKLLEL